MGAIPSEPCKIVVNSKELLISTNLGLNIAIKSFWYKKICFIIRKPGNYKLLYDFNGTACMYIVCLFIGFLDA